MSMGWSFCLRLCWSKASHAADRLKRSTARATEHHRSFQGENPLSLFLTILGGRSCTLQQDGLVPFSKHQTRTLPSLIEVSSSHPLAMSLISKVKNQPAMQETLVRSLGWENPLGKGKPTYSSILAQKIPWTVQSMGSQRVRHD